MQNYLPDKLTKFFDLPTLERIEDSFVEVEFLTGDLLDFQTPEELDNWLGNAGK